MTTPIEPNARILRYHRDRYATFLPRANFDIFNETYAPVDGFDCCGKCLGAGGFMGSELQGDGAWTMSVNTWDDCPECLGNELCPGCLQPLWLSFDQSALSDYEFQIKHYNGLVSLGVIDYYQDAITNICNYDFTCLCCGWRYDPDRLASQYDEPDWGDYGDDLPYDY